MKYEKRYTGKLFLWNYLFHKAGTMKQDIILPMLVSTELEEYIQNKENMPVHYQK